MINVIYLVSELRPSGPINQALNLVSSFDKTLVNAMVVTLFDERGASWADKFEKQNIRVLRLHLSNRFQLLTARRRLLKIVKEHNVHIVHSSGVSANVVNSLLGKSVKKISTFRSHIVDMNERSNWVKRMLSQIAFKWSIKAIDKYVCCSQSLAYDMEQELGTLCQFVQNGADIDHYIPVMTKNKIELRKKLNLPTDKIIFVSVGVIEPRKNMSLIVEAFNRLTNHNIYLAIVGWGPEDNVNELKTIVGNNKDINLVGSVNDPLEYYQCADVFISASFAEGLPNTVLEAMSCGLPVLLSDIGPHKEMLAYKQDAGIIFNHYNVEHLQRAIINALQWDIHEKSKQARLLIELYLSKYCTAANYTKLYKELLDYNL